jgi:hypothetical protein
MSKAREENICKRLGRIRRRICLIKEGRDSNLLSTEASLIKISKINQISKNPRRKSPWEKREYHQYNVGDAKKNTCTGISLTEEIK